MPARLIAAALAVLAVAAIAAAVVLRRPGGTAVTTVETTQPVAAPTPVRARAQTIKLLTEHVTGALPAPLQDPAAAVIGRRAILLGGLTAADTSSEGVISANAHAGRTIGSLPSARHDTAAATLGSDVYLFGGGNGVAQLDDILRVDPATGASTLVGHLPAGSSDSSAAAIGGTAYVVGGYTGTRWLDTIVAWHPGAAPRIVAHLPHALRYAAVAVAGNRLVIAGGSLEDGTASSDVLAFAPSSGRVVRLGKLPAPTTHAAAAALGSVVYVIGGRGATLGSATDRIVAIDVASRRVRAAGTLTDARSDLAAATVAGSILLFGGHAASGTVATIASLAPHRFA